jgi:hypothetical protein
MVPTSLLTVLLWVLSNGAASDPPPSSPADEASVTASPDAAAELPASSPFRYSLGVTDEVEIAEDLMVPGPAKGNRLVLQPGVRYKAERWTAVAQLTSVTDTALSTHTHVGVRELYGSVSLGDFDLTAGKRLLRWGTGYAFTATGVLDPPRRFADPGDRLSLNEGRELVEMDWTKGDHSITVAWATAGLPFENRRQARDTSAMRYTVLVHGWDVSLIAAHDGGGTTMTGGSFTRVFGDSIEVHGEFAHRERAATLIGGKYTRGPGITVLAEFYSPPPTAFFRSSLLPPGAGRQKYSFVRVGKTGLLDKPGLKDIDVALSVLTNLNDGSRILLSDIAARVGLHLSFYCYGQYPFGTHLRTEYGRIPYSALVSIGTRYYF